MTTINTKRWSLMEYIMDHATEYFDAVRQDHGFVPSVDGNAWIRTLDDHPGWYLLLSCEECDFAFLGEADLLASLSGEDPLTVSLYRADGDGAPVFEWYTGIDWHEVRDAVESAKERINEIEEESEGEND